MMRRRRSFLRVRTVIVRVLALARYYFVNVECPPHQKMMLFITLKTLLRSIILLLKTLSRYTSTFQTLTLGTFNPFKSVQK
jgi:hypothetical protein